MKQILQNLKTGATELVAVPAPKVRPGHLLIRTRASVVSSGTERMLVEFGRANLLEKARQQPERVLQVVQKIRTDGLLPTLDAVFGKLDQPLPLGYSSAGVVLEVGEGVAGFSPGDRLASNGPHAGTVCVPVNLCAAIPESVADREAAFAVLGAIALQGVRLAEPTLGERFVVAGLGLIGLLAVQLLQAHGCRVLGLDFDPARLELARSFGAETHDLAANPDPLPAAARFAGGRGVDGVLIAASTRSSDPVRQAARMCRQRGRIVLVGVAGLELDRADFYEKELTFRVSCSYGPGRYDPEYEDRGRDYPFGFVRWTEQRNIEAVLAMMAAGRVRARPLITHTFAFAGAEEAYRVLCEEKDALGLVLDYPRDEDQAAPVRTVAYEPKRHAPVDAPTLGVLGAGNYAARVLLPILRGAGVRLHTVASAGGTSAAVAARKFGFARAVSEPAALLAEAAIDTVLVATRHDSHARYVCAALESGKHVFCEKPLCLTRAELQEIRRVYEPLLAGENPPLLMLGYNRRFAPLTRTLARLLTAAPRPKCFVMTVNAGALPAGHWTRDARRGGGRILGEACHFVDLLRFLAGAPVASVQARCLGAADAGEDTATITLGFADGSLGTIHYFANGAKAFPKERLEVFCAGGVLVLDNFRTLRGYGWPGFCAARLWAQDKGNGACLEAFLAAVREGAPSPIPLDQLVEVQEALLDIVEAVRA